MTQIAFKLRLRSALEDVADDAAEEVVRAGFWRPRGAAANGGWERRATVIDLSAWKRSPKR
jgi:hypothetical protein